MSCNISIVLAKIPIGAPAPLYELGRIAFDVSGSVEIAEQAAALGEDGAIKSSGIDGVFLSDTPKNRVIMAMFQNADGVEYSDIPVIVTGANLYEFPENVLRVKNWNECDGWGVELLAFGGVIEGSKNIPLCSLPTVGNTFAPYFLESDHIDAVHYDQQEYTGTTNTGYWFPLIDFGPFGIGSGKRVNELSYRLAPHLKALLEVGFCQLGYKFQSDFLDTKQGKRIVKYLANNLRPDDDSFWAAPYETGPTNQYDVYDHPIPKYLPQGLTILPACGGYNFKATKTKDQELLNPWTAGFDNPVAIFDREDYDGGESLVIGSGNGFFQDGIKITGINGQWKFRARFALKGSASSAPIVGTIGCSIVQIVSGNVLHIPLVNQAGANMNFAYNSGIYTPIFVTNSNVHTIVHAGGETVQTYDFTFTLREPDPFGPSEYYLTFFPVPNSNSPFPAGFPTGYSMLAGATIEGQAVAVLAEKNAVIFPQSYFGTYTLYDIIAAYMHEINGRIDLGLNNTVEISPMYSNDANVRPYGKKAGNRSPEFICCTKTFAASSQKKVCSYVLGFKKTTDAILKNIYPDKGAQLYDKTEQFDISQCEGQTENRNPYIEPTSERLAVGIASGTAAPYLPYMVDNENNELSYNIGMRTLVVLGKWEQKKDGANVRSFLRNWDGVNDDTPNIPYAAQSQQIEFDSVPSFPNINPITSVRPAWDLIYGDAEQGFYRFWKGDIVARKSAITGQIIVPTLSEFRRLNFRDQYAIDWRGTQLAVRIVRKDGYALGDGMKANVELQKIYDCE